MTQLAELMDSDPNNFPTTEEVSYFRMEVARTILRDLSTNGQSQDLIKARITRAPLPKTFPPQFPVFFYFPDSESVTIKSISCSGLFFSSSFPSFLSSFPSFLLCFNASHLLTIAARKKKKR